jgi:hypothetical protein
MKTLLIMIALLTAGQATAQGLEDAMIGQWYAPVGQYFEIVWFMDSDTGVVYHGENGKINELYFFVWFLKDQEVHTGFYKKGFVNSEGEVDQFEDLGNVWTSSRVTLIQDKRGTDILHAYQNIYTRQE